MFMAGLGEYNRTIWWYLGLIHDDDTSTNLFPPHSWLECSNDGIIKWHSTFVSHDFRLHFLHLYWLFTQKWKIKPNKCTKISWWCGEHRSWTVCYWFSLFRVQFNFSSRIPYVGHICAWCRFIRSTSESDRNQVNLSTTTIALSLAEINDVLWFSVQISLE